MVQFKCTKNNYIFAQMNCKAGDKTVKIEVAAYPSYVCLSFYYDFVAIYANTGYKKI